MLLAFYMVQANPGNTTCSQPPNSATVGMNDITPPRIEDEEQEVIKMQHVDIQNAFVHMCIMHSVVILFVGRFNQQA